MPRTGFRTGPRTFPTPKAVARAPKMPRKTQFPQPPAIFASSQKTIRVGGPEAFVAAHPELFGGATVSKDEGYFYWAMLNILGKPETGGWSYQAKLAGGRHLPGGSMPDFIYWNATPAIVVMIQGSFPHLQAGPRKLAFDEDQIRSVERMGFMVIQVFSEQYIDDPSGQAVILIAKDALKGIQRPNPGSFGTSRVRAGELRPI